MARLTCTAFYRTLVRINESEATMMPHDANRTARLEARISPDTLAVVKRAAELEGRSVSDFVVMGGAAGRPSHHRGDANHSPLRRGSTHGRRSHSKSCAARTGIGTGH